MALPTEFTQVKGNVFDIRILRKILSFVKPYKVQFLVVIALSFVLSALTPLRPYLIQHTIDNHLAASRMDKVLVMTYWLLFLLFLQGLMQYLYLYGAGSLGHKVICDIRIRLYKHVQSMSLRFFDTTPIGRLVTRCVSDIETLLNVFSEGLASILGNILQLLALLILMFLLDWKLTLICLATLPVLVLSTYVFKEKIKVAFNQVRAAVSHLNTFVQEHITGMSVVQVFGVEQETFSRFKKINTSHRRANMRSVLYYSIYFPIAEVLQATSIGLIVWYGTGEAVEERLTLGVLIAFIMYVQLFFRPIHMIADRFNTLQLGIVSAYRIMALLEYQDPIRDTDTKSLHYIKGHLRFENVSFAYQANQYVLQDISFEMKPNQVTALVGVTGSGKTSAIHLISRLYEHQKGTIFIDEIPIQQYKLSELRKNIGFVLQDVFLFSGSLRENITLYDDQISDNRIEAVARDIGVWQFIEKLGLDYKVMERGTLLSVGERQLIVFIRAIVYDPKILVLDEAMSSVDSKTESLVQRAMLALLRGRSALIVAHRLATIQHADNILVFDKGRIVEQGTHKHLLQKAGTYHKLHHMQYKERG